MNAERIRKAAEWAKHFLAYVEGEFCDEPPKEMADAAHILGKLAAGEWVLCRGEPRAHRWKGDQTIIPSKPLSAWANDCETLHARIPEEP